MGAIASQITSLMIVYSTVYSDADQRKHQSSASLAFVCGIHRGIPHKWPVTRKMFPFDEVIMRSDHDILRQFHSCLFYEIDSELHVGSLNRLYGQLIYLKVNLLVMEQRLEAKLSKLRSEVDRVNVRARLG